MIDFVTGNNSSRFSPDVYIKTKDGSILAFIKLLEALAALAGLICLVLAYFGLSTLANTFSSEITEALNFVLPSSADLKIRFLINSPFLIPVILLMLILMDGLGTFLMRFFDLGTGVVLLVHFIYWILHIIEIIFYIVFAALPMLGLNLFGGSSELNQSMRLLGIFLFPVIVISLWVLLFTCNYHHDIYVILKTVQQERITGKNTAVGNNHLLGRCNLIVIVSCLVFLFSAFLLAAPFTASKQLIPEETWKSLPDIPSVIILAVNCIICFLGFLKYLCLRNCVRDFLYYHSYSRGKSASCFVILLIVVLCLAAYFYGRNNGAKKFSNRNSGESSLTMRTSAPVSEKDSGFIHRNTGRKKKQSACPLFHTGTGEGGFRFRRGGSGPEGIP